MESLKYNALSAISQMPETEDMNDSEDFLKIQMSSDVYQEWSSPENDIYDELFKDKIKMR